jgi:hypothetical protein
MKLVCQILALLVFDLTVAHAIGYFDPHPLPHRAITETTNWGQGHAPQENRCPPGTLRFETDDNMFLECYREGLR